MRILIISWWFPPWNEIPSGRPYSWARHFAQQGHPTTVLTPVKSPTVHGSLTMPVPPQENLEIVETPLRLRRTPVFKGASWAIGSLPRLRQLMKRQDVVISSYMPWHVHVLGRFAKEFRKDAIWVADYRDLWNDNHFFTQGRPFKQRWLRFWERRLIHPATQTVTVSTPFAERLARTHPHIPCAVIYNGFPEAEWRPPRSAAEVKRRFEERAPVRILYTGTVYEGGYQTPEPLFRVLAERKWSRPVRVLFYGQSAHSPLVRELRSQYSLEETVLTPDTYLSRADCLALQRDVDLLLHLGWTDPNYDGVLTGKIFEYMASGTPILNVGSQPDSLVGQTLQRTGTTCCAGDDLAVIRKLLVELVDQGEIGSWFAPKQEELQRFTREQQARELLKLVERWHEKKQSGAKRTA